VNISIPIYESQLQSGDYVWYPLGLGAHGAPQRARHTSKVRQRTIEALRKVLGKLDPAELARLQVGLGLRLEKVHLQLKLRGTDGKNRVGGVFPLLVDPRAFTADGPLEIAYHPMRQDNWFPVQSGDLERQATLFFQKVWQDVPEHELDDLTVQRTGRLLLVAFDYTPRNLLDKLKKSEDKDRAMAGGRKRPTGALVVLPEIGDDLTARASTGTLQLGRPRSPYRQLLEQRLGGRTRRPVALIGRPGVGKTTLARRWVHDLLTAEDFPAHHNLDLCTHVWAVRGQRIIAGMSYVGQWEQRCLDLLDDVRRKPAVLFVEDLHAWGRIGQSMQSSRALADLFRGPLARGEVTIIAETTPERWQQLESDAPAFANLFSTIVVEEPTAAETFGMLVHQARTLEDRFEIAFQPLAFRTILELGGALFTSRAFPGKAFEMLEGLARQHELAEPTEPSRDGVRERISLGPREVFQFVSHRTGVPEAILLDTEPLAADDLRRDLGRYVMGQNEALDATVDVILRIKAGLTDARRPYNVMLFTGPTGTGKTEMARCIAAYLYGGESRLLRFDMSEFGGPDGPARLVGDRHRPEGLLTAQVQQQPFCVVLLDEIEKAHPQVLNLLLQVFDEGRLTDAGGNIADFTHAVVVMTSNLGARNAPPIGFGEDAAAVVADMRAAIEAFFPPELFNRIDRIVGFWPLSPETARRIADKELRRLLARRGLLERHIYVQATDAVLDRIVADGFEPRDGARSLKRYLDRTIGALLAEEIATSGAAQMRRFHLYRTATGFALQREVLTEARPEASSHVEPFLRAPLPVLFQHLPAARTFLAELIESPRLAELTDLMRRRLSAFNVGRNGVVNEIYNLDAVRQQVLTLQGRIDRALQSDAPTEGDYIEVDLSQRVELKGPGKFLDARIARLFDRRALYSDGVTFGRLEVLHTLAEVRFLQRAIATADAPDHHAAVVELVVIGEADERVRFGAEAEGLLSHLARSLVGPRLMLEGAAAVVDGAIVEADLPTLLAHHPRHLALGVGGLSVVDLLMSEHGAHARESLGATSEVVMVRVLPHAGRPDPASLLRDRVAQRSAFAKALDAGHAPLPENPDALLPLVRRYHFDGDGTQATIAEIEDFRLYWAARLNVRAFGDLVEPARLLHMARVAPEPPR